MSELERLEEFSKRYRELCRELNLVLLQMDHLIELDGAMTDWPDWAHIGKSEYVLKNGVWIKRCKN